MNDERPIEKLLRRYAKKRRDDAGAPVELPPATRRMLQGEVARQFSKSAASAGEPPTFAQFLSGWRARLIWAIPVFIVLGIGTWVVLRPGGKPGDELQLAKHKSERAMPARVLQETFNALETPKAAAPSPSLAHADRTTVGQEASGALPASVGEGFGVTLARELPRGKQAEMPAVVGLAATPRLNTTSLPETDRLAANELAQSAATDESRAQSTLAKGGQPRSASQPAATSSDAARQYFRQQGQVGDEGAKLRANTQAFINNATGSNNGKMVKSGGLTPVLANFQVEQAGNQLRVIDGDGSTYLGEMESPTPEPVAMAAVEQKGGDISLRDATARAEQRRADVSSPTQQAAQSLYAYRVVGTNRTLNQQVVFAWNFVDLTNALAATQGRIPPGGANMLMNNLPAQQLPLILNNSAISGRAQLGNAKEIEINAVPASP